MHAFEGGRSVARHYSKDRRDPDRQVEHQKRPGGWLTPPARRLGQPHQHCQHEHGESETDRPADTQPARQIRTFEAGQQSDAASPNEQGPSTGGREDAEG